MSDTARVRAWCLDEILLPDSCEIPSELEGLVSDVADFSGEAKPSLIAPAKSKPHEEIE